MRLHEQEVSQIPPPKKKHFAAPPPPPLFDAQTSLLALPHESSETLFPVYLFAVHSGLFLYVHPHSNNGSTSFGSSIPAYQYIFMGFLSRPSAK